MVFSNSNLFKFFIVLLVNVALVQKVQSEDAAKPKYISCNPAAATQSCPENSRCIDNGTQESFCVCSANFSVNPEASKTNPYCMPKTEKTTEKPITTTTTEAATKPPTTTTKATTTESAKIQTSAPITQTPATATTPKPEENDVKVAPVPHLHVMGGIFLPIFIVLGFIGSVFVIKKYELLERAHSFIRNRGSNQNQYNGLMENDFDDDACLI